MKRVSLIMIAFLCMGVSETEDVGCLSADIIFILDYSSSHKDQTNLMYQAVNDYIIDLDVNGGNLSVGIVPFSTIMHEKLHIPLTSDRNQLANGLDALKGFTTNYSTEISTGFIQAYLDLQEILEVRSYRAEYSICILISDGQTNTGDIFSTEEMASLLKSDFGVNLYTIDTNPAVLGDSLMQKAASPGCYIYSNYVGLLEALKKLNICG